MRDKIMQIEALKRRLKEREDSIKNLEINLQRAKHEKLQLQLELEKCNALPN